MSEARTPTRAECLHCGTQFTPRKYGHVFCCITCRHLGERPAHERVPADSNSVARLFDQSRDPNELVRPDDWFAPAGADPAFRTLYAHDTVAARRRWYRTLKRMGRL